ncbi:MAG: exopolyphosphatase [Rhodobacteraceae bacterium]|nr:exopolyphosphatase [Paracoccaceae bacterium]
MNFQVDPTMADWEPFGRPLFDDPSAQSLSRVGVVDVGSNSVRLVVFDGAARSPAYFFNEKVMCGLGSGLSDTGRLNPEGRKRALKALARFQTLAAHMDMPPLTAVATAAVRDAEDGPEFCDEVLRETGLKIHVIPGEEEARYSAQGVLLGWPDASGLVCDIGGSSMELAELDGGVVGRRQTSNLGPLKLQTIQGGAPAVKAHIKQTVEALHADFGTERKRLFLVGGSWRAIAKIDMARRDYPLRVLHEYRMTTADANKTARYIAETDPDALRSAAKVSSSRMELVPLAIEVLTSLVRTFHPTDIAISSYGIREGLLYEQMPPGVRDRDPLIEACMFAETKDARSPGYGRTLFRFVLPLFPNASPQRLRLIRAACLLHDVSWRAHPDYRAETCFDYATRANLGGLDHAERVFLALAMLHRYTNKRSGSRAETLLPLLTPKQVDQAELLGKAMRFGAMLWLSDTAPTATLNWQARKKVLELKLSEDSKSLFGEVAESRFQSLASAIGARPLVTLD